jgi:hypothetical protein
LTESGTEFANSAAGSQTRVCPDGFNTWARVVTSKVRHSPAEAAEADCAKRRSALGNAAVADAAPATRRKSRLFIRELLSPFSVE